MRRRIGWLAAILVLAIGISSCTSADVGQRGSPESDPPLAQGAVGDFFGAVGKGVLGGTTKAIGGKLGGWFLNAIGLGTSSPDYTENLEAIEDQLVQANQQLNTLNSNIEGAIRELEGLRCDIALSDLTGPVAVIKQANLRYQGILSAARVHQDIPARMRADLQTWQDTYGPAFVNGNSSSAVDSALLRIQTTLLGADGRGSRMTS